jgi:hypothetical protein
MSRPIKTETTSFIRRSQHEMTKPIKLIGKELEGIIEKLLVLCTNEDKKIAVKAMETLLDYYANAVEMKSKDEILRMMAESKKNGGMLGGSTADQRVVPMVNFGEIQDIN